MKLLATIFLVIYCHLLMAQLPNVDFDPDSWTTNTGIEFDVANNKVTVTGNLDSYVKTTLDVGIPDPQPSDLFFISEVKLTNVDVKDYNIKNPTLEFRNTSDDNVIVRMNMNNNYQNEWFRIGVKIEKFYELGLDDVRLSVGINKNTGTMEVKEPYLSSTPPDYVFEYPFETPANTASSLNIISSQKHPFENNLLSTNSHFVYADTYWGDPELTNAINMAFPMKNMRFPGGTVGNYYDYETDSFYPYGSTPQNLVNIALSGFVFNYNGYKNLCIENDATATLVLNLLRDDANKCKAQFQNRINSGLNIKWIELGNELYLVRYRDPQDNVPTVDDYIQLSKDVKEKLIEVDPGVKVAYNVEKDDYEPVEWNLALAADQDHIDAGVVHQYISTKVFFHSSYSVYSMFTGCNKVRERINEYNTYFPGKPMIVSEWGILSEVDPSIFPQTLGIVDMFLALEEGSESGIVQQAGLHQLYKNDNNTEATLMLKENGIYKLTSHGFAYSSLFDICLDAEVFNADAVSGELIPGLKTVNAKAFHKGSEVTIVLVNKLDVSSEFTLFIDGEEYTSSYELKSFLGDLNTLGTPVYNLEAEPWEVVYGTGKVSLPALSYSLITIPDTMLGVQEIIINGFNVFPNPFNMSLKIISDDKNLQWFIYSLSGEFISKGNNKNINTKNLPTGMYLIKCNNLIRKIIKH